MSAVATMCHATILLLTTCSAWVAPAQDTEPSLEMLAKHMIGSFSSAQQAAQDSDYFDIELEVRRIWPEERDGIWLYVEQAVATKKDKPYRQRFYHLAQEDDSTFISTVCTMDSIHRMAGAYRNTSLLNGSKPADVRPLPGCALTLHWRSGRFIGSTHERDCRNAWGKATYATSEVEVFPDRMISWDRGYNDAGEQVWGAEKGGYIFVKKQ